MSRNGALRPVPKEAKMNKKNVGIYVHIPFCKQKCRYCDFKSYVGKEDKIEEYIKWIKYELAEIGTGNRLDYESHLDKLAIINTIYIGGGTPSLIDSKYIKEIMETIKANYTLEKEVETTIEVNPGMVTENKLQDYIECGINRISIGLQSSKEDLLKQLGRIHTYEEFEQAFQLARKVGFKNINVDLMIGLPNQAIQDVEESIEKIIEHHPEHISVYSLIVEEGTPIYDDIKNKKIILPEDELERKMYWQVKQRLEKSGYIHYEISNFAKQDYESKHNMNCWNQEEYIGVGVAAHSYTNNVRYSNIDSIEEYIKNYQLEKEEDNLIFHEKQNKNNKMKEYMLLGLRKLQGVQIQEFKRKFRGNPIYLYHKQLEELVSKELVEVDGDTIKLTNKGLDLANLVWKEFV